LVLGDNFVESCFSNKSPWCALLAHNLTRIADVENRGAIDYDTASYFSELKPALQETDRNNVGLVILFIGIQDSYGETGIYQHFALDFFAEDLTNLIKGINASIPSKRILLILGPPGLTFQAAYRTDKTAGLFNDRAIQVANDNFVKFLDLRNQMKKDFQTAPKWEKNFIPYHSGVKFNEDGAYYFFNYIRQHVHIKLKEFLHTAYLNKKFPDMPEFEYPEPPEPEDKN